MKYIGCISLCHRCPGFYRTLRWEKEIRMVSSKIYSCVEVNCLLLWRILNLFRFRGSSLTSKQPAGLDFQSNRLLGPTDAGTTDSAAQFQANDISGLFCYFPLFPWSTPPSHFVCFLESQPSIFSQSISSSFFSANLSLSFPILLSLLPFRLTNFWLFKSLLNN